MKSRKKPQNGRTAGMMSTNLVIWLYSIVFTLCLPFVFLRLLWRSRKNPLYRERWLERLGISFSPVAKNGLWLHAVSAGETIAATPLIRAFQKKYPTVPVTITTTTPTGAALVKKLFNDSVSHVYFPYDLPWTFHFFLSRVKPRLCVIMETELWVNALRSMKRHHVPCIIANGRLSHKSMKGYEKILFATRDMLSNVDQVAAQSFDDGQRFVAIGLDKSRLTIAGNVKFDVNMPTDLAEKAAHLKNQWGSHRPVWIAASTHGGEDTDILWVHKELKKEFPDLLLVLVPRHPERFDAVADEIKAHSLSYVRRSTGLPCSIDTEVFLGDTMGEMPLLYKASDVAFVGGSFAPIGGHNTLEPAALSIPSIVGPHTHNFVEITQLLKEKGALKQVADKKELLEVMKNWLHHPEMIELAGTKGLQVVLENKGAVDNIIRIINAYFN